MFEGNDLAEAMGVPLYYGAVEAIVLGIYCVGAWKMGWTKAPPTDSFWKTISTSYEVLLTEQKALDEIEVSLSTSKTIDTMESQSPQGSTIFHYFQMDDSKESRRRMKERSGLDLNAIRDSFVISSNRTLSSQSEDDYYRSTKIESGDKDISQAATL